MAKLIYNPETLLYEIQEESKSRKAIIITLMAIGAVGLVCLYFWLYTCVFGWDLPKTAALKRRNARWQARMELVTRRLDVYEQTLEGIENRDDDVYRSIYGLNEVPAELSSSGPDWNSRYEELDRLGADQGLKSMVRRMDDLTRRVYVQGKALDEVAAVSRQTGDMISCVPSVPPVLPDPSKIHLSSPFGMRSDPVYGGGEYHTGQDIAADRGYPVYAPGDGVVEKAESNFGGYGNEVVINHGYGYKTRYAHLNTIEVAPGNKVKRGDRIGTVGSTGKSTGPHLHYEVIYRDERVNPMNYMDINMSLDEYKSMISQREAESPFGKRSSTSELIRRRSNE